MRGPDGKLPGWLREFGRAGWRTGRSADRPAGSAPAAIRRAAGAFRAVRGALARRTEAFHTQRGSIEGLHVAGLWAVAMAQPIYDLLGRSPEFFVAHDARPGDLLGLVVVLGVAGPACCLAATRLCHWIGPRTHALAGGTVVGALAAGVALAAIRQEADWNRDESFAVAAGAGALVAGGYVWFSTARLFATFLSPAALVVPAVFLAQPAIAPLLSTARAGAGAIDGVTFDATPPVAVVVFDQLPLVSLLDGDGGIDRTLYPNFAALADDATWFRNASAVGGWTEDALPAIVTGNYPVAARLPTAADHPGNLFTLLGSRYDLHVLEPLTDLCPETLCEPDRPGAAGWFTAVLSDLAVVYLQAVLPRDLAISLPPVTQSWRDFVADDTFLGRWHARRVRGRDAAATDFIDAISENPGGGRSPLYFMHLLLPHEPWLYLPTGHRHTLQRHMIGISGDRWGDNVWAVARNYQRHLLQVQFVDGILGAFLERLRAAGLYDDALIVVTSDHGASLRPGAYFRLPTEETFADIAAVPLLIKQPEQRTGRVVATNVETIDILPTLAAGLGVRVPWETDGSNVFAERKTPRPAKTMVIAGERVEGPASLGSAVAESVAHKLATFENGDPAKPRLGGHDDLVGAPVAGLRSEQPANFRVSIDSASLLNAVDFEASFVPAHIIGGIVLAEAGSPIPPLAVAVNGVVAAVTRTYPFRAYDYAAPWEVVVDPHLFEPGANTVSVFAIATDSEGGFVLREAFGAGTSGPPLNLLTDEVQRVLNATSSGFLETDGSAEGLFRWTTGRARLSAPVDPQFPPAALTIGIVTTGPWHKQLQIAVNGCTLFEGPVVGRWRETFALDECPIDSSTVEIALLSNVHLSQEERRRRLGVAVSVIELRTAGQNP